MENQNSVCFVSEIDEIKLIEGADKLELAVVKGWNCIVPKNTYKVNDLVICATTDAVIPEKLASELGVTSYLRSGNRVRTIKLRGQYSECLLIPKNKLPNSDKYVIGNDVMDVLGIFKYEPPIRQIQLSDGRKIKYKDNPNFKIYYKFPNLKNVKGMFTEDDKVEITRKIHGTNARYGIVKKTKISLWDRIKKFFRLADEWVGYEFIVGSHNVEKGSDSNGFYDVNVWYEIEKKYDIKQKLWKYVKESFLPNELGSGLIIYGEIYGAGIQKGYDYGLKNIEFLGFDATINGKYLTPFGAKYLFGRKLSLPYVPILYFGEWSQEIQDSFVFNNYIDGTKIPHEGIVIKDHTGMRQKVAKVINPDYLIFSEKHNIGDSH